MSALATFFVGLVIVIGIAAAIIQVLPSGLLVGGAILVWAIAWGNATAWWVFGIAAFILVVATVAKYLIPGRRLLRSGIPNRTILIGLLVGAIGFFVVPVVGFPIGLVGGIYAAERAQGGSHDSAWPRTLEATKTVGISVVIELTAALAAAAAWLVGVAILA